jgi:iron complex outermembrane recepter protein
LTRPLRSPMRYANGTVAAAVFAALSSTVAFGASDTDPSAQPSAQPSTQPSTQLQEIVVTASRRASTVQNLPFNITAVSGTQLQAAGITDMASLTNSISGVNFTDKGPFTDNGASLVMRGLNADPTAYIFGLATLDTPPVSTYMDDTPLFANLQLQDLERVEVLQGPQGTLYGSGSLGGTVRFIENPPDLDRFDAQLDLDGSKTAHSEGPNYDAQGVLNLPLIAHTLALRLDAGNSYQAGWIDQPLLYRLDATGAPLAVTPGSLLSPPQTYRSDGTNSYRYDTARVALLWKPNDVVDANLSYFYQLAKAYGYPYAAPLLGLDNLESVDHLRATSDDKNDILALTVNVDFGFATLTSDTSWAEHTNSSVGDLTDWYSNFPFYSDLYGMNPRYLQVDKEGYQDKNWVQELRLVSNANQRVTWIGGLFYRHETTDIAEHSFSAGYLDYFNACVPIYGVSVGDGVTPSQCGIGETQYVPGQSTVIDGVPIVKDQSYIGDSQTLFKDLAAYGDATWHITPSLGITGGARVFREILTQAQEVGLLFDGPAYIANESLGHSWDKAIWRASIEYHPTATNMLYATWAQGFRRGTVNALPPTQPGGIPTPSNLLTVQPDTADNYEIGVKGTVANRLQYSADVFDIDWHNVQEATTLTTLGVTGVANIGDAYSRGFETDLYARLTASITGHLSYTYDETQLTSINEAIVPGLEVPPPAVGSPLPGTPKNSVAASLSYLQPDVLGGSVRIMLEGKYQSRVLPAMTATIPYAGGFTTANLRLSYSLTHWTGTLYCDNLTNNLGVTSFTDPGNLGQNYQAIIARPRTVGLNLSYSFR